MHTTPDTPFVVAWGDPAVVLRCGVARPASLQPGSAAQFIQHGNAANGPYFDVTQVRRRQRVHQRRPRGLRLDHDPGKYQGGDVMPPISAAIAKALPAVCSYRTTRQPGATALHART